MRSRLSGLERVQRGDVHLIWRPIVLPPIDVPRIASPLFYRLLQYPSLPPVAPIGRSLDLSV